VKGALVAEIRRYGRRNRPPEPELGACSVPSERAGKHRSDSRKKPKGRPRGEKNLSPPKSHRVSLHQPERKRPQSRDQVSSKVSGEKRPVRPHEKTASSGLHWSRGTLSFGAPASMSRDWYSSLRERGKMGDGQEITFFRTVRRRRTSFIGTSRGCPRGLTRGERSSLQREAAEEKLLAHLGRTERAWGRALRRHLVKLDLPFSEGAGERTKRKDCFDAKEGRSVPCRDRANGAHQSGEGKARIPLGKKRRARETGPCSSRIRRKGAQRRKTARAEKAVTRKNHERLFL